MEHYVGLFVECWPSLLAGLETTILIAVASLFFAFFLGIVLAVMGLSPLRPLQALYHLYIYLVRGVPVMIFALFLFFGVGGAVCAGGTGCGVSAREIKIGSSAIAATGIMKTAMQSNIDRIFFIRTSLLDLSPALQRAGD